VDLGKLGFGVFDPCRDDRFFFSPPCFCPLHDFINKPQDSTLIMQLLRDNLTLWTSDQAEGEEEPAADEKGE
jgi:hypothetical protein